MRFICDIRRYKAVKGKYVMMALWRLVRPFRRLVRHVARWRLLVARCVAWWRSLSPSPCSLLASCVLAFTGCCWWLLLSLSDLPLLRFMVAGVGPFPRLRSSDLLYHIPVTEQVRLYHFPVSGFRFWRCVCCQGVAASGCITSLSMWDIRPVIL